MEDLEVCAGETPRFAVVVEGKPVPDILWLKVFILFSIKISLIVFTAVFQDQINMYRFCFQNDILLSESCHYTFVYDDNECSLVVLNARPEDSGVYTCTARNLTGSVSCKAELTIHEGERSIYRSHTQIEQS